MKKIFKILALSLFISCKAQTIVNINTFGDGDNSNKYFKDIDNNFQNFTGTWESSTNNITFRLSIWKVENEPLTSFSNSYMDVLYGKYLIIENAGIPNEIILYNSIKYFPQSNYTTNWVLYGSAYSSNIASGGITDTNANNETDVLEGAFNLKLINLNSNPLQAEWKVIPMTTLKIGDSFTIPTNIILTKTN